MTAPLRARFMLALLVGVVLATFVAGVADARLPHARRYRAGGHISLDTTLLSKSGLSAWAIDDYLAANTSLPPLGAAFMAAERTYGVNARFLLAAALHESGWGTGYIARHKHNLFGYNAYDRDPVRYANAYGTYTANIDDTARFIKDFYLTPSGRWWGGQPTLRSMQQFWSSSDRWGVLVGRIANSLRFDTLRKRGISFTAPDVGGPVHHGAQAPVTLTWSGGALPASVRFVATWEPVVLDADVVAAASTATAAGGIPAVRDAAPGPATTAGSGPARAPGNPAPAGDAVVGAKRLRTSLHTVELAVPTPTSPGEYVLRLQLRDAGGGPLPAADQVPIPGADVRVWADRAVSYAIEPAVNGGGAVVRITNTGRTTIPAAGDEPASASNNPEIQAPRTVITVTTLDGGTADTPTVLAATPLRSDLRPGASVTIAVPGIEPADWVAGRTSVAVSVLGDPTWLGATSTGGAAAAAPVAPASSPTPPQLPAPSPSPSPAPSPSPTASPSPGPSPSPAVAPSPAPRRAPRHVTVFVGEHSGAVRYRGTWADASSAGYLGGRVAWSRTAGSSATLTFTGSSVAWIGPLGPTRGRATVLLDGHVVARLNLWRSSFDPRATLFRRTFAGSGRHRLTIEVLGGGVVAIDGFQVRS